ncbi:MAG: hypothetical protein HN350_13880 [Phycisphaerales bacterium]|jgi:hypothetical protein|nr:hypothetical protein [Phycisphaerales bacterium]
MKAVPVTMLVLFLAAIAAQGAEKSKYTFTLNGDPVYPDIISLDGDDDNPKAGDLVNIDGHLLTLGKHKKCDFIKTDRKDGRLCLLENGKKRVVGVRVGRWFAPEGREWGTSNPLAKLSAAEVKGLWGLVIEVWPEGIEKRFSQIDPLRTCVTVRKPPPFKRGDVYSKLPTKLRYLNVNYSSTALSEIDYTPLGQFDLRVLVLRTSGSLDTRLISKNKHLRHLNLSGGGLANTNALASLTELRELDLSFCMKLKNIEFVRGMKQLEWLDLWYSGVTDLSPLGGLPKLQRVNAYITPVSKLPMQRMPALLELQVMCTKLDAKAVQAFRKTNPKCRVKHKWNEELQANLKGVNRISVSPQSPDDGGKAEQYFTITDAKEIKAFLSNLRLVELPFGGRCECNRRGNPIFYFYKDSEFLVSKDTELLMSFGLVHDSTLRSNYLPSDAFFTEESLDYLLTWLAAHGVKRPLQISLKKKKERELEKKK